jgi:pseudouridine synthase
MEKMPLTKAIASSNLCSRRKAEELIRLGLVLVNQEKAQLGDRVNVSDNIVVSGKKITIVNDKFIYIALNKPASYVCTNRIFKNEKNIFELLQNNTKLIIVGRLDKDSKGLILLTSDGDLAYKLSHPKFKHEKKYIVKTKNHNISFKEIKQKFLQGIEIEKGKFAKMKFIKELDRYKYEIILTQGLNRQIRKMFLSFNIQVLDIERLSIASLQLKNLPIGKSRNLIAEEVNLLKNL